MLPPVLSILLHSSLPPTHSTHLRTSAAQTMSHLLTQHSTTYPSLAPRIMKTLLLALVSNGKSRGTREGAIRGLVGVGKDAIRKGLIEGHGAKVAAQESQMPGYSSLAETVMVCCKLFSTCAHLLTRHCDSRTRLPPYSLDRSRLCL